MNIFNLSLEEIDKRMKEILSKTTPEELLSELIECGYKRVDIDTIENETKKINYRIEKKFNMDIEYLNFIKLHRNSTTYNLLKIFSTKSKNDKEYIEMGDAA